jgi:outer membrane lipoprotein-sorting protein
MKRTTIIFLLLILPSICAFAQASSQLESVLNSMDKAAATIKTVQTDFVWDQYTAVINEHETQTGTMYFRRAGNNIEMSATVVTPPSKPAATPDTRYILFTNGIVQVYQPKADQLTKYNAGKNRETFESFLVLGFGGRGQDLHKSFDVKYGGPETTEGVAVQKLLLTPKSEKIRNMFQTITLWIDPARGVSVQQKFEASNGDYRLATYKNIKINEKLPDVFKLKTTNKTTVVTPQG